MAKRDVVVVGASAGGVEALRTLVSGLPADFPGTLLIVLHVPRTGASALPQILDRAGPLPVRQAVNDDPIRPGEVLVAPPDRHLVVYDDRVTLSKGPTENGHRPAVDVLFRSAAKVLGPRVIGVVLSGALDDGTAGMVAVRLRGGVGVVQDPDEALHAGMPRSALQAADPEHVVPVAKMAALLGELVTEDAPGADLASELMEVETGMAELNADAINKPDRPGVPAGFACPDCNGSLYQIEEGGLVRYRCRVGHAWSQRGLLAQQSSALEGALWMALRSLEEKSELTRDMARRAVANGHRLSGDTFERQSAEALRAAGLLRDLIAEISAESADEPTSEPAGGG